MYFAVRFTFLLYLAAIGGVAFLVFNQFDRMGLQYHRGLSWGVVIGTAVLLLPIFRWIYLKLLRR